MKKLSIIFCIALFSSIFTNLTSAQTFSSTNEQQLNQAPQENQDKNYSVNWHLNPFDFKLFIENKGQFDNEIKSGNNILFVAKIGNIDAYFHSKGITYRYQKLGDPKSNAEKEKEEKNREKEGKEKEETEINYLNLIWEGANPNATITAEDAKSYYYTYPIGTDKTIKANVFREIIYHDLFPGIDIKYFFPEGKEGIKYNIIAHPGADVSKVKLKYKGALDLFLNEKGEIIVNSKMNTFTDHFPICNYEGGGSIDVSYSLKNKVESFYFKKAYDKSKTIIIDPWTTNPLFAGGYNDAYEVDWDDNDNVYAYGSWGPSKLVKLNSAGVIQWTFNATTINTNTDAQWGDFAVDRVTGTSYLVEGYNSGLAGGAGARSLKVRSDGTLAATFTGNTTFEEMDRVVYCPCTRQLVIGGGGTNATNQACVLDTNMTGFVPHNVLGADLPYHDIWLAAMDPSGTSVYLGSANSCCNNNTAYDDRLLKLNVPTLSASTFNNNIHAWTYMPEALSNLLYMTWSGVPANGFNGSAASKNFLYIYDGADLFKVNKTTGNLIVKRAGVASTMQSWGGLDVDICDNVYVGSNSKISVFNGTTLASASAATSTITLPNTVYDVKLGRNFQKVYACGHTYVSSVTITAPPVTISKVVTQPTCGNCNGIATANLSTCGNIDTTGATYIWSNGATTHTITGLCPGVYSVTITPAGTCSHYSDTVNLTTSNALIINAISDTICPGQSTTLTATGATTYTWMPGNLTGSSVTVSPTSTTTYTVTGVSSSCTATASLTVTVNSNLNLTATASPASVCPGGNSTLTATGGTTYTWSPGNLTGTSVTVNPTSTTTYTVTGTSNGCTGTATVTVTVNPNLNITATASPTTVCPGGNSTLTATGGTTYSWSPGNLTGTSVTVSPTSTTIYTVTGTSNGCTGTATVTVTVNPNLNITATASPTTVCPGGNSTLTATGGTTYTWSPGSLTGASVTVNPTSTTTYTVPGTSNGYTGTATVTVTVNPNLNITATASPTTVCPGGNSTLTATGGTTYTWSPGSLTGASVTVSPTSTTSYTVTGTSGGCTGTATVTVTVNSTLNVTATALPSSICIGDSSTLTASGGTVYTWNPGGLTGASIIVSPSTTTTYTVTGTSGGCTGTASLSVNVDNIPVIAASASPASICIGQSSNLTASGANTYNWTPGNLSGPSINVSPSATTVYTVTGTTAAGCTASATVTVSLISVASLYFTTLPNEGCVPLTVHFNYTDDGTIDINSIHWDFGDPSTTADVSNLLSPSYTYTNNGNFIVTLSGQTLSGCNAFGYDTIQVLPNPMADFTANPWATDIYSPTIHFYDASLNANEWLWNFGDATNNTSSEEFPVHTYSAAGDYPVMLIVHNGECADTIIKHVIIGDGFTYYIPNTFSTNEDNKNEIFNGKGTGYKTDDFEMYIFDRWGEVIFHTTDSEKGWDGKYNGTLCMQGVYVYKFKVVELNNKAHIYAGSVVLIK